MIINNCLVWVYAKIYMYRRQWQDSRLGFQKVDCLFDVAGGQVELSLLVIRAGYCLLPLILQGCRDRVWIAVRNLVLGLCCDSCPRLRVQISTI